MAFDGVGREQDHTLEINLQDDDNVDNSTTQPDDDELQLGLITGAEKGAIQSCAAGASIPAGSDPG